MGCVFCPSRQKIEILLSQGHCDEEMRHRIRTLQLEDLTYEQNLLNVNRLFKQWTTKPICLPSYNYNGKRTRPDWSEEIQKKEIQDGLDLKRQECKDAVAYHFSLNKPLLELSYNLSQIFGCSTEQQKKDK